MTAPDPRDPAYLEHMLEAIERIQRYVGRKRRAGFLGDTLLQDAVIRNIEIVGQAASRVSPDFAAQHAEIPWRDIVGMRHRLIHGYLKLNLDTVWEVVERDLPALVPRLRALLGATPAPPIKPRCSPSLADNCRLTPERRTSPGSSGSTGGWKRGLRYALAAWRVSFPRPQAIEALRRAVRACDLGCVTFLSGETAA